MAKIFFRERVKVGAGDKQPRYAVVGVEGTDMTFFQYHLRRSELESIAKAIGADLVELPRGSGEHEGEKRKKKSDKKHSKGDRAESA